MVLVPGTPVERVHDAVTSNGSDLLNRNAMVNQKASEVEDQRFALNQV